MGGLAEFLRGDVRRTWHLFALTLAVSSPVVYFSVLILVSLFSASAFDSEGVLRLIYPASLAISVLLLAGASWMVLRLIGSTRRAVLDFYRNSDFIAVWSAPQLPELLQAEADSAFLRWSWLPWTRRSALQRNLPARLRHYIRYYAVYHRAYAELQRGSFASLYLSEVRKNLQLKFISTLAALAFVLLLFGVDFMLLASGLLLVGWIGNTCVIEARRQGLRQALLEFLWPVDFEPAPAAGVLENSADLSAVKQRAAGSMPRSLRAR